MILERMLTWEYLWKSKSTALWPGASLRPWGRELQSQKYQLESGGCGSYDPGVGTGKVNSISWRN